ncbi:3-oxo-tetronate kinase [Fulvimarina sp. 2208YS6-2-32]|uniref:3-oxo-tetronate kinase n=1 Tax=Fulvimarina uroteuthidis TaxID=3098149 RepID=A0ABU5I025_9HYPH|nr:3-oxo-tetronate kinase [Fulvimarina sp. 2208YS6-2-32]MDY8108735.1 3-oxo-tetronate kinase [Fulvimarina sp. 2208YS6-2-32]
MKLGCIGDDFTGSSDLANMLAKEGMRVTQFTGVPQEDADDDVDAGVVALKSRTTAPEDAVRLSLQALQWLQRQGCTQFFFKYCSTFDSTKEGNIGPVIDALMKALHAETTIVCPSFPATGRSVYQGHLFVGDRLLSESGMEDHPLTPMVDADIRRWLGYQTSQGVGHVPAVTVFDGHEAIAAKLVSETRAGRPVIVVDAIRDADLRQIGAAAKDLKLVTGGSGVALGLPANILRRDEISDVAAEWQGLPGPAAILAGSASKMTQAQVRRYAKDNPSMEITAEAVMNGGATPDQAARFALEAAGTALLYSSANPETVKSAQKRYGRETIAARIEDFFAQTARLLVDGGIERLVTAGGETSGAVVEGLGLSALRIGPEIAPGVPALKTADRNLVLALKSGNFGDEAFFEKALALLDGKR